MDVLLPQAAIDTLPFRSEPFSQWSQKTDIYKFIAASYKGIYAPYSKDVYLRGKKDIRSWGKKFKEYMLKEQIAFQEHIEYMLSRENFLAPEEKQISKDDIETGLYPNFFEDSEYGKASKYLIAWQCCVGQLLEESAFYSLAHLLETETELESSLLLASQGFYKQSVQVLRSFLEELIMPIHFCENEEEFNRWNENNYHTPPLRGRDGIIRRLTSRGVLQTPIADETANLYGDLNSYIHGSENRLNYKNVRARFSGPRTFRYEEFLTWAEYFSRSVDLGIRLLRINYLQWDAIISPEWEALRASNKVICFTCRNETDFDIIPMTKENFSFQIPQSDGTWAEDESFPGFIRYRCRRCNNIITVEAKPN